MTQVLSEEEALDAIISAARMSVDYWTEMVPAERTCRERISGAIFTFLAELDGTGGGPCVDMIVLTSDPETGETIGETRVSTMFHELLYPDWERERARREESNDKRP